MQKIDLDKYELINKYLEDLGKKHDYEESAKIDFIEGTYNGLALCLKLLNLKTYQRTIDGIIQLDPECVQ